MERTAEGRRTALAEVRFRPSSMPLRTGNMSPQQREGAGGWALPERGYKRGHLGGSAGKRI